MSDRYAACGKEVLRDGVHFADCAAQADAERVAALLNLANDQGWIPNLWKSGCLGDRLGRLGDL